MHSLLEHKGFNISGFLHVTPREAFELCRDGAILLDVREPYMNRFRIFDVEDVLYCPMSMLPEHYTEIPACRVIIAADAAGLHSREAIEFLQSKGIENLANMAGGLVEWERDGLPVRIDNSEMYTGSCLCQLRKRNFKE
jgi:rhodanese-related sulfurtransferase